MFRILILTAGLVLAGASGARAQQLLAEYYTLIAGPDLFNSSGARLGSLDAFLQQDRANFHRFGRAHPEDGWDPLFTSTGARQAIPQLYAAGGGNPQIEAQMRQYGSAFILVRVWGYGGQPAFLEVYQGAG